MHFIYYMYKLKYSQLIWALRQHVDYQYNYSNELEKKKWCHVIMSSCHYVIGVLDLDTH